MSGKLEAIPTRQICQNTSAITHKTELLTLERAIAIQTHQIDEWATVLNPETTKQLRVAAERMNRGEENPYNIWRGSDIDQLIADIKNQNMTRI